MDQAATADVVVGDGRCCTARDQCQLWSVDTTSSQGPYYSRFKISYTDGFFVYSVPLLFQHSMNTGNKIKDSGAVNVIRIVGWVSCVDNVYTRSIDSDKFRSTSVDTAWWSSGWARSVVRSHCGLLRSLSQPGAAPLHQKNRQRVSIFGCD